MKKRTVVAALFAAALGLPWASALSAQSGAASAKIGPVSLTWGLPGKFAGNQIFLRGGVHMTATDYDLQAPSLTATLSQANGGTGIAKATAEGDAAKNAQVVGRFEAVQQGRTYYVNGDHAVYTSVASQKNGGRIDFTGHVVVTIKAPQALEGPAVIHTDQATVLLGQGADYPQVTFGAGTATFTPTQK